jgi:outer membrane protein TolC
MNVKIIINLSILLMILLGAGSAPAAENLLLAESGEQPSQSAEVGVPADNTLTLEQALSTAMSDSTTLQLAEQAVELARAGGRSALAGFNPDLSMMYSYTRLADVPSVDIPDVGTIKTGSADTFRLGLTFKYPLYSGEQDSAIRRASEAQTLSAELKVEGARLFLGIGVTTAYTMVLEAGEALDASRRSLDHLTEMLRVAQANFDAGYLPESDLLSIQVAKAQADQAVIEAEKNLELARSGLALAIGGDITDRWKLEPVQFPESDIPFTKETLWDWALAARPEMKDTRAQRDALLAQMDAVRSALRPRVSFQADYSTSGDKFPVGGSGGLTGGTSISGTVGIFWDLYDFGRTDDTLAPMREQMRLIDLQEQSLSDQIKQEVESALLNVRTQLGNLGVMRGAVAQAEEAFRVAKRRQEEGLGITLEVLNAEDTLSQTTLGLTHMLYEYYRDLATLAQTLGMTTHDLVALVTASDQGEN